MQTAHQPDKNIQFLIAANYRRMMSFEQAAFLTKEESFKAFYLAKADESEFNIKQLYLMLNIPQGEPASLLANSYTDTCLQDMLHGKKTTLKVLECVKTIEKTIAQWYKSTITEMTDLPGEIMALVKDQYKSLHQAQLQLNHL